MMREIKEETGLDVEIEELSAFVENLFVTNKGENCHELCYIYRLKPIMLPMDKAKDWHIVEFDDGINKDLDFKWLNIKDLDKYPVRPSVIKQIINKKGLHHVQIVNEEIEFLN